MAKKKPPEYEKIVDKTKYIKVQIEDEMKKSFISYAMAVNVSRAIPDVRDGLKPVHRRILYAMGELNMFHNTAYRKCAKVVGDVLGKYHPHGDSSVYFAMVRLAQDFSIRYPLIDGQGNFGSIDGDPPAAQRYTESRLSAISSQMLRDIDKNTVDYYPNFDETLMQPTVLPARIPNLLVNGSDGIAVGMATNIPPHNLGEVIDGVVALIDDPEIDIEELIRIIPAPDYPTGGIIMSKNTVRHAYKSGRGGIVVRAKAEIEEYPLSANSTQMRQRIIVHELPYQVNKSQLIENIAEMVRDKRIEGISDIRDESDRKGMRIVFEIKRDAQANVVLNLLYKHSSLQTSGGIIFLSLVNGEPKILNLKEMLFYYLEHQKEVIVRRTQFDLNKAEERAHILEGLVKALANIDRVIAIIRGSRDNFEAAQGLMNEFFLTDRQAQAILEMRLRRLTSLEVETLRAELAEIQEKIAELKSILASPKKVLDIVKSEILEIKEKYGDERRTEISEDSGEGGIDIGDMIEKEDVVISLTHFGYIKRLPVQEYKSQKRGGKGVIAHKPKEEDFVTNMFVMSTHDDLMFFSNMGKAYSLKGYEIPEGQRQARGRAIVNLLSLSAGEKITAFIPINEEQVNGNLLMATKFGMIKKTLLSEFKPIRKGGKIAMSLSEGDELISVQLTFGVDEIMVASHEGKCIRFSEEDVRLMGRDTQGVKAMKLDGDDYVVDMTILKSDYEVLTISANGYGKRTEIEDYRLQSRAGKGIKAGVFNKKTGKLVGLKLINPEDDIMIISADGTIIRVQAKEISKINRDTQGVRLMKVRDSEVVCIATADPYEEIEE